MAIDKSLCDGVRQGEGCTECQTVGLTIVEEAEGTVSSGRPVENVQWI